MACLSCSISFAPVQLSEAAPFNQEGRFIGQSTKLTSNAKAYDAATDD
jgi:hypothetical protein